MMQLVVDIPEDYYRAIKEIPVEHSTADMMIIRNGTPLPAGHGELKDIDKIIRDGTSKGFCDWYDEMRYADTIIEADKESEDKHG